MKQWNAELLQSVVGSCNREKDYLAKRSQIEKTTGRELWWATPPVAGDSGRRSEGRHVASKNEEKIAG